MTRTALAVLAVLGGCLAGCPQQPVTPPPPDATDAVAPPQPVQDASPDPVVDGSLPNPCAPACAALAAAGCQLGTLPHCGEAFQRDFGTGKVENKTTHEKLTCDMVATVRTKADAQRMGFVCAP